MSTLIETNLSLADVRLNTVMKKLASWAALIAVPTLITGFMGMNVPYPGYNTEAGFLGAARRDGRRRRHPRSASSNAATGSDLAGRILAVFIR